MTFFSKATCFLAGARSLVPVARPPTFSIDFTSFADTGSVIAVNRMGVSVDRLTKDWAAGVAIPKTKSFLESRLVEIVWRLDWSPWAFW